MELTELRRQARERLRRTDIDLLDMLCVLLGEGGNEALQGLLADAGVAVDALLTLTARYQAQGGFLPQSALTRAICDKQGAPFCDTDLLDFLFTADSDYLFYLSQNGFDTAAVPALLRRAPRAGEKPAAPSGPPPDACLTDLSALAKKGAFDSLSGREDELEAIENILLRRDKANVILTGEAGVGKTAVAQLLAKQSAQPGGRLSAYTFYSLDLTALLGAQPYRGELERRVSALMQAVSRRKNTVLFLDEIHRIGQPAEGQSEGARMADLLKPYLTQDNIRILGATTTAEYQKTVARDPALERRFQQVKIAELTGERLFAAVRAYADALEAHHAVILDGDTLAAAITLTGRYLKNRRQPDKSNELLDSACVAALRDASPRVEQAHLHRALAAATHIPEAILAQRPGSGEDVERRIKRQLFGQDEAVARAVKTLRVKMAGFKEADAPLAAMIFAGDSGVGKTRLAALLAQELLGGEHALTVLDMAEFSEPHSVSKLVGSPPGYVGSDREGVLTAAIAAHPFGLVLFDEIEKAAPEVHRLLLGVLDSGRVRSGLGTEYDAGNTAFIFTTNAVSTARLQKPALGFSTGRLPERDPLPELAKTFPTEFLGRIDEIILFNALTDAEYRRIITHQLMQTAAWFEGRAVRLSLDPQAAADRILKHFTRRSLGARGLFNELRTLVTLPVMEAALRLDGDAAEIDVNRLLDESLRTEVPS